MPIILGQPLNEIYHNGVIREELSRSIVVELPKKPGANECDFHRTMELMSHLSKLIIRILMPRKRSGLWPEIRQGKSSLIKDNER